MRKKINISLFVISIIGFLLLSVSFLLMPLNNELSKPNFLAGILFWLSCVIGVVPQILLSLRINHNNSRHGIGLLKFFQNPYAIISDIAFVISVIGLIVAMVLTDGTGYLCYVFISMTVFFFAMHCIFNGKNYFYIHKKYFRVQKNANSDNIAQEKLKRRANNNEG